MASFRKRGGKWQARVHRKNHDPVVKSFASKSDAARWARNIESGLDLGAYAPRPSMPRLVDLVQRYLVQITPTKKGATQEQYRAGQLARMLTVNEN